MAQIVTAVPKATRETKYDYDTLFDGNLRKLVQGEDFDATLESFRGALYNRKALINKENPEAQIGVSVKFRTEDGKLVAYVQKVAAKPAKKAVAKKAAPAKKAAAPKTTKTVAPSPKA